MSTKKWYVITLSRLETLEGKEVSEQEALEFKELINSPEYSFTRNNIKKLSVGPSDSLEAAAMSALKAWSEVA